LGNIRLECDLTVITWHVLLLGLMKTYHNLGF
jgi:hypothetical protein